MSDDNGEPRCGQGEAMAGIALVLVILSLALPAGFYVVSVSP